MTPRTSRSGRSVALAVLLSAATWPAAALAQPGITTRMSVDGAGTQASADGRLVVFASTASTLVPGDTNVCGGVASIFLVPGCPDIFVHDRITGTTTRVSVDSAGGQADGASTRAAVSGDGRFVAFESFATNLVLGDTNGQADIFVHDRVPGAPTLASLSSFGGQDEPACDPSSSWPAIAVCHSGLDAPPPAGLDWPLSRSKD